MNTQLKRCLNANDQHCKYLECRCADTGHVGLKVLDTMTDDVITLHRVDTTQLGHRDGVSVGLMPWAVYKRASAGALGRRPPRTKTGRRISRSNFERMRRGD